MKLLKTLLLPIDYLAYVSAKKFVGVKNSVKAKQARENQDALDEMIKAEERYRDVVKASEAQFDEPQTTKQRHKREKDMINHPEQFL